ADQELVFSEFHLDIAEELDGLPFGVRDDENIVPKAEEDRRQGTSVGDPRRLRMVSRSGFGDLLIARAKILPHFAVEGGSRDWFVELGLEEGLAEPLDQVRIELTKGGWHRYRAPST